MRHFRYRAPLLAAMAVAVLAGIGAVGWNLAGGDLGPEPKARATSKVQATARPPAWLPVTLASDLRPVSTPEPARTTRQPAHVEPYERTAIYAKAAGFVSQVHVDLGSRVKKGDVLAELWIPEMEQELLQAKARVDEAAASVGQAEAAILAADASIAAARAKVQESRSVLAQYRADIALRESEYKRIAELVQSGSVQSALLDEKRNELASAKAALAAAQAAVTSSEAHAQVAEAQSQQARANLTLAQAQLTTAHADLKRTEVLMEYAVIRAPYDGLVTERLINTGDFARSAAGGAAEPLFTVMRESPLRIVVDIPESDAGWVRPGLPATLTVDAIKDRPCVCVVKRVAEMLDPKTHAMRVEVEVTGRIEGLRPGMYGAVTITDLPAKVTARPQ